jgi:hypothetical protein
MSSPKRLKTIDRRSSWARRHRQLATAFAADLGTDLSAGDSAFVDHAATVALECERMKMAQLEGQAVDLDELVRLSNALTRIRKELSVKKGDQRDQTSEAWEQAQFGSQDEREE